MAQNSIEKLDEAIASVSKQRSLLGAFQNRLEHTIFSPKFRANPPKIRYFFRKIFRDCQNNFSAVY